MVAKIHKTDTSWFNGLRKEYKKKWPKLQDVGDDSYMWYFCSRRNWIEAGGAEITSAWANAGPFPVSGAGKRVVTVHSDLHQENMLVTPSGLKVVDFEVSHVGFAVFDMCYLFSFVNGRPRVSNFFKNRANRKAFVIAYLEESNLPRGEDDVFALLLDIERCEPAMGFHQKLFRTVEAHKHSRELGSEYAKIRDVAQQALSEKALARAIVKDGICGAIANRSTSKKR